MKIATLKEGDDDTPMIINGDVQWFEPGDEFEILSEKMLGFSGKPFYTLRSIKFDTKIDGIVDGRMFDVEERV